MDSIRISDPDGGKPHMNMEKIGAINMFKRSVEKLGLYYTSFFGGVDSKSNTAVKNLYGPDKPVTKYECIGHFQKLVGSCLRKWRTEKKLG